LKEDAGGSTRQFSINKEMDADTSRSSVDYADAPLKVTRHKT